MNAVPMSARNATLGDLVELLKTQQAAKVDMVVPASKLLSIDGTIHIEGTSVFDEYGAPFVPTAIADGQLAERLGIPTTYLRKLRSERVDLFDANVNGWLGGSPSMTDELPGGSLTYRDHQADNRQFLCRTFGDADGGVLRAVLSDRYGRIDNFDVLTAALSGIQETGTAIDIVSCDLTETRMVVKIAAPEIFVDAPELLASYRDPWAGGRGIVDHSNGVTNYYGKGQLPQWVQDRYGVDSNGVFAGIVITNSETGGGAANITPCIRVLKCTNGLMMTEDGFRQVHLGGKLQEGTIEWSTDTQRKALELITAQARDAVQTFLSEDYVKGALTKIQAKAGVEIAEPTKVLEVVAKELQYTEAEREGILGHFVRGGQMTAGGVMQAVTSFAQELDDADAAFALELSAMRALEIASR